MSDDAGSAVSEAGSLPHDDRRPAPRGSTRAYWRLAGGYWRGPTAGRAWTLTSLSAVLIVANIGVQYGINRWNAYFFDAIGRRSETVLMTAVGLFAAIVLASTVVSIANVIVRMRLQVRWRQWLTVRLAEHWLAEQRFYRLSISAPDLDSPEFRIAEDARIATEPVIDFGYGIVNAVLMAVVFFSVLWSAAGVAHFGDVAIPGYMVIAAVAYSVVMSGSLMAFGRPLINRIEDKNAAEARLRYEMGRVRENAESIAMIRGEGDERKGIQATLDIVVVAWHHVIAQLARMTLLVNANGVVAPVMPLLLAAPNYLNGSITLGGLMQTAAAFVQVQIALNWLVDNYAKIAEWLASVGRVSGLWNALTDLDASVDSEQQRITLEESPDEDIHLDALSVAMHDGRTMIDDADTIIHRGEKVLLMGQSGTGKSTLIRAVAGLWPWGTGRVLLPKGARFAFLPQRGYLPLGSLRQVLEYPANATCAPDDVLVAALTRCGLRRLIPRLDDTEKWDKLLSGGEQQRLAFARLLVSRPDVVIMDEATAALDTDSQDSMMEMFRNELADCTVISVGHRPELEDFHDRKLTLRRDSTGVQMSSDAEVSRKRRFSGLLRRSLRPRPSPDGSAPVSR